MGRLIRLFLADDHPEGLRTMELSNMTVKATLFPRSLLNKFSEREEARRPAVYILHGRPIDDASKPILYIGEGDPVIQRLKDHNLHRDFWTEALVFTSKDAYVTKTQIQYLESKLIYKAKEAGRVKLENIQEAAEPTISEVDQSEVQQFLDTVFILVRALRLNFFEPLARNATAPLADEIVYEMKVKNARSKMVVRDGQYVLLTGSTVVQKHRHSASTAIKALRDTLMEQRILLSCPESADLLVATKDIPLNSASYAAAVVCGGNANGQTTWKYEGKSLKEINDL